MVKTPAGYRLSLLVDASERSIGALKGAACLCDTHFTVRALPIMLRRHEARDELRARWRAEPQLLSEDRAD